MDAYIYFDVDGVYHKLGGMMGSPMWRAHFEHGDQRGALLLLVTFAFTELVVLWALGVGAARAYYVTPCKPVGQTRTIGTLAAAGWCTVVAL